MRIAQVAPLYESVPPKLYGGTERIVHYLVEELVRQGHEVTLFASGDSDTSAELVSCWPRALRLEGKVSQGLAPHLLALERVARRADEFDVVHFHVDYVAFPWARRIGTPSVSTLHGRLDMPELGPLFEEYRDHPLVSISDDQRRPLPHANWIATIHHGLPEDLYRLEKRPDGYLAFLGRICPEKRPDLAIAIARRVGLPLKIAAKVDPADRRYHEEVVKPLLDHPLVEFVGEIGEAEKQEFLGRALALLFPIDWPEPFGLVMIEAMACGTPVIAFPRGSVPEVIDDGVTGFIVPDVESAAHAVRRVETLDRRRIREVFERRFTARRMAEDYLRVYERIRRPQVRPAAA